MPDVSDEDIEKVMNSLRNKRFKWRTVNGVAREAQVDPELVRHVIKTHDAEIVQSSVPSRKGEDLFTTRHNLGTSANTISRLVGAFKGRAS